MSFKILKLYPDLWKFLEFFCYWSTDWFCKSGQFYLHDVSKKSCAFLFSLSHKSTVEFSRCYMTSFSGLMGCLIVLSRYLNFFNFDFEYSTDEGTTQRNNNPWGSWKHFKYVRGHEMWKLRITKFTATRHFSEARRFCVRELIVCQLLFKSFLHSNTELLFRWKFLRVELWMRVRSRECGILIFFL